jgi:hypothetical protein
MAAKKNLVRTYEIRVPRTRPIRVKLALHQRERVLAYVAKARRK